MQIGSLGLGGMALPEILRAESAGGKNAKAKSIIMVLLPGGPSHLDMYDLMPAAPTEIRGEFQPISTSVPGIDILVIILIMVIQFIATIFMHLSYCYQTMADNGTL